MATARATTKPMKSYVPVYDTPEEDPLTSYANPATITRLYQHCIAFWVAAKNCGPAYSGERKRYVRALAECLAVAPVDDVRHSILVQYLIGWSEGDIQTEDLEGLIKYFEEEWRTATFRPQESNHNMEEAYCSAALVPSACDRKRSAVLAMSAYEGIIGRLRLKYPTLDKTCAKIMKKLLGV